MGRRRRAGLRLPGPFRIHRRGAWALGLKRAWIGIDDGYAAAFAALLAFEDTSGRVFLVAERYGPGMTERMRLGAVRELVQIANAFDVPIAKIVCDSAAADFIGAMRADGMEVTLANKAIEDRNRRNPCPMIDRDRSPGSSTADGQDDR